MNDKEWQALESARRPWVDRRTAELSERSELATGFEALSLMIKDQLAAIDDAFEAGWIAARQANLD
jgi:hypothetical protein